MPIFKQCFKQPKIYVLLALLFISFLWVATTLAATPTTTSTPAKTAAPQHTLIIVDAAGQEATTSQDKTQLLQQMMHEIVTRRTVNFRIGLSRFDAANNPQCRIYNFYIANEAINPQEMSTVVGQLFQPTNDPYSLATSQAVSALTKNDFESVIMVVSAADSNCIPDPCSIANKLSDMNSEFTIHLIGFESAPAQEAGLKCLAKAAQGSYSVAQNPAELRGLLEHFIMPIIHGGAAYGSINLQAVSAETGKPLNAGLKWWIYLPGTQQTIQPTAVEFSTQPAPHFQLEPGQYTVMVSYGEASNKQAITIEENQAQNVTMSVPTNLNVPAPTS